MSQCEKKSMVIQGFKDRSGIREGEVIRKQRCGDEGETREARERPGDGCPWDEGETEHRPSSSSTRKETRIRRYQRTRRWVSMGRRGDPGEIQGGSIDLRSSVFRGVEGSIGRVQVIHEDQDRDLENRDQGRMNTVSKKGNIQGYMEIGDEVRTRQGWQGSGVTRWQGSRVVRWQGGRVTRWQGGKVARWQGGGVTRYIGEMRPGEAGWTREREKGKVNCNNSHLDRCLFDVVSTVDTSEWVHPIDATYSSAHGQAVLHHMEVLVAICIEVLEWADLVVLHNAVGLEETIMQVLVAGLVLRLGKHDLAIVRRWEVPTCGNKYNSQL